MSGFAYDGKSLDELRALAESPQVGRMYEMQSEFQKIADHMDGVVSALGRLQADLPNWWTGAAADQAVSAFSQVVSVAQRVHENADGAAAVLGRCATVVSQQQAAMQDVPDVAKPGVVPAGGAPDFSVVQEAAAYQAARERAVQVVNGIAAQYVETQGQFAGISGSYVDSFHVIQPVAAGTSSATAVGAVPSLHPVEPPHVSGLQAPVTQHQQQPGSQVGLSQAATSAPDGSPRSGEPPTTSSAQRAMPTPNLPTSASSKQSASPTMLKASAWTAPLAPSTAGSSDMGLIPFAAGAVIATGIAAAGKHGSASTFNPLIGESTQHVSPQGKKSKVRSTNHPIQSDNPPIAAGERSIAHDEIIEGDQVGPLYQQPENYNVGMYGAPGGAGGYVHGTDSRKKRPSYVKEPKNAWLSAESAAPPNGLLTPDWADPE